MIEFSNFDDGLASGNKSFVYVNQKEDPIDYMKHAIEMAKKSSSLDKEDEKFFGIGVPQPKIGAILVTNDKVYCACRSALKSGDHAEFTVIETLADKVNLEQSTLYTTLEPCTPESRNKCESCSEVIINRRIRNVYIGTLDGNPLVFGRGVKYLSDRKIHVQMFDVSLVDELKKINKDFFDFCEKYPDVKVLKEIDKYFRKCLNLYAVKTYLQNDLDGEYKEATEYELIDFYRTMLKKNQIYKGSFPGQLLCTKDFALAFLNDPSLFVPGCAVGIVDRTKNKEKRRIVHVPYIELLNAKSTNSIYRLIENETNNRIRLLQSNYFKLIREVIANALVHSDYSNNIGPSIIIDNDRLEIINRSTNEINKETIKNFKHSAPVNAVLMEFLLQSRLVESSRLGFDEIQKSIDEQLKMDLETSGNETRFIINLSIFE